MAIRIGFGTDFVVKNESVGINTDNPDSNLQLVGDFKSEQLRVQSGLTSITSFDGYLSQKLTTSKEFTVDVNSESLSGEIIIEDTLTVSAGTTFTSGPRNLTVTDSFTLPGITDDRPTAGTMRFNENLGSLEFYTGVEWKAVNSRVDMGNAGRGVCAGRTTPSILATIDYIQISTIGNAINFGDLTSACQARAGGYSDGTRGVFCGGSKPGFTDDCDYITIPSAGNGIDFGNLTSARDFVASCSSSTRGITAGGRSGSPATAQNIIEYAELQTIGNHIDFGDLSVATHIAGAGSSPTRAVFAGGGNASDVTISTIQTVNFAAKGNAVKFGDLTVTKRTGSGGCSNSVRALFGGGYTPGIRFNNIDVLNLASGGNTIQGGNLDRLIYSPMGLASQTRAVFAGGQNDSGTKINTIQYVNISTLGNTVHFGELTAIGRAGGSASDSHGGLGGF